MNRSPIEVFLKHYIDCIADAGKQLNSREWWATNIASKNRFTSRMVEILAIEINPQIPKLGRSIWFSSVFSRIYKIGSIFKTTLLTIIHHYQARKYFNLKMDSLLFNSNEPRYVIKTFVYDHSFSTDNTYQDVFYGRLVNILKDHNCKVLIYAVILGNRKVCLKRMAECDDIDIIPVELFLNKWEIIAEMSHLLSMRFNSLPKLMFRSHNVATIVNNELSKTLNDIPPYQYFHYNFTKALSQTIKIETFLQTGENNPWERMCIMALREHSPVTRILSYQHAVVPQASANMFAGYGEFESAPLPDHLITTGPEPKRIIEYYGNYPEGFVLSACGLRYEYLDNLAPKPVQTTYPKRILLALEGIAEVSKMVEYAVKELSDNPEYVLTVRTHPALPFEEIRKRLPSVLPGVEALDISTNCPLLDDISRSDAVIYWGTTVALEALKAGVPVIHFDMGTRLSYDPLFAFDSLFKTKVTCKDKLSDVLSSVFQTDPEILREEQKRAGEYLQKYFAPVCLKNLKPFLPRSL